MLGKVTTSSNRIRSGPHADRRAGLIRWPERYKPEATAFHVRKELEMPVSPEAVWPWLVRAELWPAWCPEFKDVVIEGGGPDLRLG